LKCHARRPPNHPEKHRSVPKSPMVPILRPSRKTKPRCTTDKFVFGAWKARSGTYPIWILVFSLLFTSSHFGPSTSFLVILHFIVL
jgi:hypothetical protein